MTNIVRTNSENQDFINLVNCLDADLAIRDGNEHSFYQQFNEIDAIKYVVMLYNDLVPLGCGAIKELKPHSAEVKRMYVVPESRGKGLATIIVSELEKWASQLGYKKCILETGKNQPEAVALYKKNGYQPIPNYGQYKGIENSLCFEKLLKV